MHLLSRYKEKDLPLHQILNMQGIVINTNLSLSPYRYSKYCVTNCGDPHGQPLTPCS